MNKVFISVVSHHQENMIIENFKAIIKEVENLDITFCFIDNTGSKVLETFAHSHKAIYYYDGVTRGFGANHNKAFKLCNPQESDIFIVCNPDVILEVEQISEFIKKFSNSTADMGNVRCYYDRKKTTISPADRYFPCFLNFVTSIIFKKRYHYGNNNMNPSPEWLSGEFIMFKAAAYKKLNGFDESFFMYVEDIDLSYRARKLGLNLSHNPENYIIHETQVASRNILSKNFIIHLKSVFKYILKHKIFCIIKVK